jgi:hypothetical protein
MYVAAVDGLLIEECFNDMSGWEVGYREDGSAGPQPPSMYSHNFYLQSDNRNIIFRGNISSRGASYGAQVRPGGIVQRNIFIGNNAAFYTGGGSPSLVEDNVVTIAGNKRAPDIGAIGWGLDTLGVTGTVLRRNIVAHSVDPRATHPDDRANNAIQNSDGAIASDNIFFDWGSSADTPADIGTLVDGESTSILQYSAASPVGSTDLDDLSAALRARDRGAWPWHLTATAIQVYFATGFTP